MTEHELAAWKNVLTTVTLALFVAVIVWMIEALTGPKPPHSEDDL